MLISRPSREAVSAEYDERLLFRKQLRKANKIADYAMVAQLVRHPLANEWITRALVVGAVKSKHEGLLRSVVQVSGEKILKSVAVVDLFKKNLADDYKALANVAGRLVMGELMWWLASEGEVVSMKSFIETFGQRGCGPELASMALATASHFGRWDMYRYLNDVVPAAEATKRSEELAKNMIRAASPPPMEFLEQVIARTPPDKTDADFRGGLLLFAAAFGNDALLPVIFGVGGLAERNIADACTECAVRSYESGRVGHQRSFDFLISHVSVEALGRAFLRAMKETARTPGGPGGLQVLDKLCGAVNQMIGQLDFDDLQTWVAIFAHEPIPRLQARLLEARTLAGGNRGAVRREPRRARIRS